MKLLAQLYNPALPSAIGRPTNATGGTVLGNILGGIIGVLFLFSFCLTFLYIILGGVQWVSSGGDKGQLENARNKITHGIVGLILVAGAWAIMVMIGKFFGLNFPNLRIPSIVGS